MSKLILSVLISLAAFTTIAETGAGQCFVVTAKPLFKQRGEFVQLIISNASHGFEISWAMPPKVQFIPLSLETNQIYTFTVEQKPYRNITYPELRRVEFKGQTIYDVEICEVHKVRMDLKEVHISYGYPMPQPNAPSDDTEQHLFPHRFEYSLGGCVIQSDSPKTTKVFICPKCKEAFEWWAGTAIAPYSVLPRDTRYDSNQHLRLVYLEAYGKGYVAAWARKEAPPVFGPTTEEDKARVFGYEDGLAAGRLARDAWSGTNGQRYGPTISTSQKK